MLQMVILFLLFVVLPVALSLQANRALKKKSAGTVATATGVDTKEHRVEESDPEHSHGFVSLPKPRKYAYDYDKIVQSDAPESMEIEVLDDEVGADLTEGASISIDLSPDGVRNAIVWHEILSRRCYR